VRISVHASLISPGRSKTICSKGGAVVVESGAAVVVVVVKAVEEVVVSVVVGSGSAPPLQATAVMATSVVSILVDLSVIGFSLQAGRLHHGAS
jgi:hypothetical protein